MKNAFKPILKATLVGVGVLIIGIVIAFFASSDGVSPNTEAWPVAAKAILNETPTTSITPEQWKRIRKELANDPNTAKFSHLFAAEIRNTWLVFVPLWVLVLLLANFLWKPLSISKATALLTPTVVFLIFAFQHVHPYYR
jgi:hypothetical protein